MLIFTVRNDQDGNSTPIKRRGYTATAAVAMAILSTKAVLEVSAAEQSTFSWSDLFLCGGVPDRGGPLNHRALEPDSRRLNINPTFRSARCRSTSGRGGHEVVLSLQFSAVNANLLHSPPELCSLSVSALCDNDNILRQVTFCFRKRRNRRINNSQAVGSFDYVDQIIPFSSSTVHCHH